MMRAFSPRRDWVPVVAGEEGGVLRHLKADCAWVKRGEAIAELETDKASVEIVAACDGMLSWELDEGSAAGNALIAFVVRGRKGPSLRK